MDNIRDVSREIAARARRWLAGEEEPVTVITVAETAVHLYLTHVDTARFEPLPGDDEIAKQTRLAELAEASGKIEVEVQLYGTEISEAQRHLSRAWRNHGDMLERSSAVPRDEVPSTAVDWAQEAFAAAGVDSARGPFEVTGSFALRDNQQVSASGIYIEQEATDSSDAELATGRDLDAQNRSPIAFSPLVGAPPKEEEVLACTDYGTFVQRIGMTPKLVVWAAKKLCDVGRQRDAESILEAGNRTGMPIVVRPEHLRHEGRTFVAYAFQDEADARRVIAEDEPDTDIRTAAYSGLQDALYRQRHVHPAAADKLMEAINMYEGDDRALAVGDPPAYAKLIRLLIAAGRLEDARMWRDRGEQLLAGRSRNASWKAELAAVRRAAKNT